MKIYISNALTDFEPDSPMGCFDTIEKAVDLCIRHKNNNGNYYDGYSVSEMEINSEHLDSVWTLEEGFLNTEES